jgi:hypothetical protein
MKFNQLYKTLIEALDPDVEAAWARALPHLESPKTYYTYTVEVSRGRYDVWHKDTITAKTLEEAQDKVLKTAQEEMKSAWEEDKESAREDYDEDVDDDLDPPYYEFIEKEPILCKDMALVNTGEETVILISEKPINTRKAEAIEAAVKTCYGL